MINLEQLYEALFYSLQIYEKIVGHVSVFVCSKEVFKLLNEPEFVLGKSVEVDENLFGFTSDAWYWM